MIYRWSLFILLKSDIWYHCGGACGRYRTCVYATPSFFKLSWMGMFRLVIFFLIFLFTVGFVPSFFCLDIRIQAQNCAIWFFFCLLYNLFDFALSFIVLFVVFFFYILFPTCNLNLLFFLLVKKMNLYVLRFNVIVFCSVAKKFPWYIWISISQFYCVCFFLMIFFFENYLITIRLLYLFRLCFSNACEKKTVVHSIIIV